MAKQIILNEGELREVVRRSVRRILREDTEMFYDYMEQYGANYVFSTYLSEDRGERQSWAPLINPNMYYKALSEFQKYGSLKNFPSKYVYQWIGIILKNTAMLVANTEIMGHSNSFPTDEFEDFAARYLGVSESSLYCEGNELHVYLDEQLLAKLLNDDLVNEGVGKYGQTYFPWMSDDDIERTESQEEFNRIFGKYGEAIEEYNQENDSEYSPNRIVIEEGKPCWIIDIFIFLHLTGIDDWMIMPDGSDAISDYGLDPLVKIIQEYNEDLPPEDVLVIVNKCLDVYHQRGDLSSIFVQGGTKALNKIAGY